MVNGERQFESAVGTAVAMHGAMPDGALGVRISRPPLNFRMSAAKNYCLFCKQNVHPVFSCTCLLIGLGNLTFNQGNAGSTPVRCVQHCCRLIGLGHQTLNLVDAGSNPVSSANINKS